MPTIRFAIDIETYEALTDQATRHLRSTDHHAAVLLRQALGLPFPLPEGTEKRHLAPQPETSA
jgi:hypothetical protein